MKPNIFVYQNYRDYLRDLYLFNKQESATFSHRKFSQAAGFKSPNFLKRVIDGDRNLTLVSLRKMAAGFRLSPAETTYFRRLIDVNQAKTNTERNQAARELVKSTVFRELYPLKEAELNLYQLWYCIPIREMIAHPGFREDFAWIGASLRPQISAAQARQAVETLLTLGLVTRTVDGFLNLASANIATDTEVHSAAIAGFHKQMLELASQSIDKVARSERVVSGATVLISESRYLKLKEMIQTFAQSLLAEAESAKPEDKSVYQISFQAFPLSETLRLPSEDVCLNRKKAG